MKRSARIKLFLVDDDAVFLKALEIQFLRYAVFSVQIFTTGEACIKGLPHHPDIIILDYELQGIDGEIMSGINTLDRIKAFNPTIPVVMLSSQDKMEVAVKCIRHNAYDYIVKSETAFIRLQKIIATMFPQFKLEKSLDWYV